MDTATASSRDLPASGGSPIRPFRRPRLRPAQRTLVALEAFVSVCGLAGGTYMATHPLTIMPIRYLEGTWFHTWRWPGIALFLFVGVCPALVAAATVFRLRIAVLGHVLVGTGLSAWILLEAIWVVVSPGFQIAFGALGVLVGVLGAREWAISRKRSPAAGGSSRPAAG